MEGLWWWLCYTADELSADVSHLELAGCAEAGSFVDLLLEGCINLLVGMADNCGAPAADVVDVFVSIDVPAVGVLDAIKDDRLATNGFEGAHGGVDTTGKQFLSLLENLEVAK